MIKDDSSKTSKQVYHVHQGQSHHSAAAQWRRCNGVTQGEYPEYSSAWSSLKKFQLSFQVIVRYFYLSRKIQICFSIFSYATLKSSLFNVSHSSSSLTLGSTKLFTAPSPLLPPFTETRKPYALALPSLALAGII